MRSVLAALLAAMLAVAATAQCPFSVLTLQQFAPGCNSGPTGCCAIAAAPATISGNLDVTACQLDLTVHQLEGCCGVHVMARALVIGTNQTPVPLPIFGQSCTLWVGPLVVLVLAQGDTFSLPIPSGLPPLHFLVQGVAVTSGPILTSPVVTLSPGYDVGLR